MKHGNEKRPGSQNIPGSTNETLSTRSIKQDATYLQNLMTITQQQRRGLGTIQWRIPPGRSRQRGEWRRHQGNQ